MKRLISYFEGLTLARRESIVKAFLSLVNLPVPGSVYHHFYDKVVRGKASHGLAAIDIETYNVCNLRCTMCPYPDMTREKVQMGMDLFQKIVDDAAASGIRETGLTNYGEPLLDSLLFDRIKYAKSKGLRVHIVSNGTLLTEDKTNALLDSGIDAIEFSFDGATEKTYEKIRVGADFERTKRNIIGLIRERERRGLQKPSVGLYFVAQESNYGEAESWRSLWKQSADYITDWVVDSRKDRDKFLPKQLQAKRRRPRYLYPCTSLFCKLVVLSSGKVALCCVDYDGEYPLGNLTTQTINEVFNSREYKEIRDLHLRGRGDRVRLCGERKCRTLYRDSSYDWWRYRW